MRVTIVAGMIVAVHVAVVGSVVLTQGCASSRPGGAAVEPIATEPAPPPVLPPVAPVVLPPHTLSFPPIQPPANPEPAKATVDAANVYVVKSGDSLSKIAAKHGVNARELAELNQIVDANKIRVGQKLLLPDYSKPSQSPSADKASGSSTKATSKAAASGATYEVKSGDSLSKIAAAHGVKTKALMEANNITDANKIRIGQKLTIPGEGKAGAAKAEKAPEAKAEKVAEKKADEAPAALPAMEAAPAAVAAPAPAAVVEPVADVPAVSSEPMLNYTVQDGDTIETISRLFVVKQDDIRRVNNIPAGQDVKPNQRIQIPPTSAM